MTKASRNVIKEVAEKKMHGESAEKRTASLDIEYTKRRTPVYNLVSEKQIETEDEDPVDLICEAKRQKGFIGFCYVHSMQFNK